MVELIKERATVGKVMNLVKEEVPEVKHSSKMQHVSWNGCYISSEESTVEVEIAESVVYLKQVNIITMIFHGILLQ